jgi:dTDP-glucose 4,6-dehydratase
MPRAVVTGGAGFIPSHVCEELLARDWEVVALDNFVTGRRSNLDNIIEHPGFTFIEQDVIEGIPVTGAIDAVLHLASPASPPDFGRIPLQIMDVGSIGTRHALNLAERAGARFLLASTSEVYGDPLVHPQPESYWGNVNSVGPRAVYDEAKRFGEAMTMAFHRLHELDTKIVRIFNTYGPRLAPNDGRVVSNFLDQARRGLPLTIYGGGSQSRSFCFVDDEVRGILALLESSWVGPMNIGNPNEFTMLELAEIVREITGTTSTIEHEPLPPDDPTRRRPDITLARRELGWEPVVQLREGLGRTYEWYRREFDAL